jgi:pimeloyl-ACP methyl ester carboxylesterase
MSALSSRFRVYKNFPSIAYKRWGDPSSPHKALCFHGWLDNAASFNYLGPYLASECGFDCIAVDHVGHGRSGHLGLGSTYTYTMGCTTIHNVIDYLSNKEGESWAKPTLIGHSMSAGQALMFAASFPEKLSRLVMIEGFGPVTHTGGNSASGLRNAITKEVQYLEAREIEHAKTYKSLAAAIDTRKFVVTRYPGTQTISREAAAEIICRSSTTKVSANYDVESEDDIEDLTESVFVGSEEQVPIQMRHDKRLQLPSHIYMTADQVLEFTDAVQCKSLLITAEHGWPVSEEMRTARINSLQSKNLLKHVHIEGSHHCHLDPESREIVAREIQEFLTE